VAIEIGPPDVLLYSNLSLALLTLKQYREGEEFARKALALDPENAMAQRLFKYAAAHSLTIVAQ
jgi:tetratricopeptide (TPR) repeat protein